MRLKVFKLRRLKVDDELYKDIIENEHHPSNSEVDLFYKEITYTINVMIGDIIELGGIRYFCAPSGIERHKPAV